MHKLKTWNAGLIHQSAEGCIIAVYNRTCIFTSIFCLCGRLDVSVYSLKDFCDKCEDVSKNNGKRCVLTAVVLQFCCQYNRLTGGLLHWQRWKVDCNCDGNVSYCCLVSSAMPVVVYWLSVNAWWCLCVS